MRILHRHLSLICAALLCSQYGCIPRDDDYHYDSEYELETDTDSGLVNRSKFEAPQLIYDAETIRKLTDDFEMKEFPASDPERPLVVLFHGYGNNQDLQRAYFKLGTIQKRFDINLVTLNGEKDSLGHRFWNACNSCCDFDRARPNHKARIATLIRLLKEKHAASQVILWGHSNGAFLAYHLACETDDDLVDGVFAFAGLQDKGFVCKRTTPLKVIHIHGRRDDIVLYDGGQLEFEGVTLPPHSSVLESFEAFSKHNNCQGEKQYPLNLGGFFGIQTKIREATGCDAVTLLATLPERGHVAMLSTQISTYAFRALLSDEDQQ